MLDVLVQRRTFSTIGIEFSTGTPLIFQKKNNNAIQLVPVRIDKRYQAIDFTELTVFEVPLNSLLYHIETSTLRRGKTSILCMCLVEPRRALQ